MSSYLPFMLRIFAVAMFVCLSGISSYAAEYDDVEVEYHNKIKYVKQNAKLLLRTLDHWDLGIYVDGKKQRISIPVEKIRSVDGGTIDEFLKAWKEKHADELCPTCGGDCTLACKKCDGTGVLADTKVPCKKCNGAGKIPCTEKNCKDGQVPCPGSCLKLSEGEWVKGKPLEVKGKKVIKRAGDNQLWIMFWWKDGCCAWSEGHVGEIIKTGDGRPKNLGKCPVCKGKGTVPCKICQGKGELECPVCKGEKEVSPPCDACKNGKVNCPDCAGRGLKVDNAAACPKSETETENDLASLPVE